MIRKHILRYALVITALIPSLLHAQKVDTVTLDGKEVFVYPFKVPVSESPQYWNGIDTKKMIESEASYDNYLEEQKSRNTPDSAILNRQEFRNIIKAFSTRSYRKFCKYYSPKMGPKPTEKEFKAYAKLRRKRGKGLFDESTYFSKKKFVKAVRENPYAFLVQNVSLEQDITPMLDPIPDGAYIQYYEPYLMLNPDGSCESIRDQIAGYFTIKDNVLHGEATWVDFLGDTIKHGHFDNGLKVGEWMHLRRSNAYMSEEEGRYFVETGIIYRDTTRTITNYRQGIVDGNYQLFSGNGRKREEGTFADGEHIGEWRIWWEYKADNYKPETDEYPLRYLYVLNEDDSLIVHPLLVRNGLYEPWEDSYEYEEFNFFSEYDVPRLPKIYEPAFPRETDLELEEEGYYDDYYGDYYPEGMGYYDEYYGGGFYEGYDQYMESGRIRTDVDGNPVYYDETDDKRKLRSTVFDSLGAYPMFDSIVEAYYPNGQLVYRYEFENGLLKQEPTVYWDNGNIHDEVTFDADSNEYERKIYDYDGELFHTARYDSAGNIKEEIMVVDSWDTVVIDGYHVDFHSYSAWYEYAIPDSILELGLKEKTLMEKNWRMEDTSVVGERHFDPNTFEGTSTYYSILGGVQYSSNSTFSENYESWTGTSQTNFGDFQLRSVRSAGLGEWAEPDSIPILMLKQYHKFDVERDNTLYYKNEPFTGPMQIDFRGNKFAIGQHKIVFPRGEKADDKMMDIIDAYRYGGKIKNRLVLETYPNAQRSYQGYIGLYRDIFVQLLSSEMNAVYYSHYDHDWDGNPIKKSEQRPTAQYLEGEFLDGKPEGKWLMYDQFGKVMTEANFHKGELDGKVLKYGYEDPVEEYYVFDQMDQDTMPDKRTYYLASEENYSKGMREGKSYGYDWLGRIISEDSFKDGYLDGLSIERNHLAVSMSEFKDGVRDGYSRTYLTLEGEDSLLLYDLNFQNGLLQGESKSYHTNGKISKRGFFLQGEPIEDYEGYDSLGFRYHYVKFQYSFPVEEKLWEENELSVRYKFDWEDSIYFVPLDITESESLESLLVRAGLSGGWEYRPYYGRQAIVDKDGVDYHLTKYYPNDTVARDGAMVDGKKSGHWEFFSYDGEKLYEVNYFDSVIVLNDSIKFNSKGIYTDVDADGNELFTAYIIEKSERFDCSHKDHYEVRQFFTISEAHDSLHRMNGEVFNFYDNGTLQSYGTMKNGLPDGAWRYYDPAGKLNKYGNYVQGKRNGRWLSGDLSKTKYLGDICLNPNMPDIEEEIRFRENFLDIEVINYVMGKARHHEYYDINMNRFIEVDEQEPEWEGPPPEEEIIEEGE